MENNNFNLVFDLGVPEVLKSIIIPLFQKHYDLVPKWVEDVYVYYEREQSKDGTCIECVTEEHYRRIMLRFYPDFVHEATDQEYQFVHDLCHPYCGILYHYASELVQTILSDYEDEKFRKQTLQELFLRNETVTQDLANLIFKLKGMDKRTGKKLGKVKEVKKQK